MKDSASASRGLMILAPPSAEGLASRICAALHVPGGRIELRRFPGGEFKIRPLESVRGRNTWIVQSMHGDIHGSACDKLCELLFLGGALHDAGAASVGALLPYLSFARKDRRTKARDPITSRYVAQLIEAVGFDRVMAVEVHNPAAFDNAHRICADHLPATRLFADEIAARLGRESLSIVSPDPGGIKRAQLVREAVQRRLQVDVGFASIDKRRTQGILSGDAVAGSVDGRHVVMIDDLISTGGTLLRAAGACRGAGAVSVHAFATHAALTDGGWDALRDTALDSVTVTDTIELSPKIVRSLAGHLRIVSVAPMLAQAIACTEGEGSLVELLEIA